MHERALRLTYSAYTSTSQELLDKDVFVEVYSEHCQTSKKECFAKIVTAQYHALDFSKLLSDYLHKTYIRICAYIRIFNK